MNTTLLLHKTTFAALDAYMAHPGQSILLTGKAGNGKTILASELAASLVRIPVAQLKTYAYAKVLRPDGKTIPIERIRELAQFVQLKVPSRSTGVRRVIIIEDADAMTREAQNGMLKLLEEPPEQTVIILTSSHPGKLLSTIRSRTRSVVVNIPDEAEVLQKFTTDGYEDGAVRRAAVLADGSIGRLHQLLTETTGIAQVDMVKTVLSATAFDRLADIDKDLKDKVVAKEFVDALVLVASASLGRASQKERWLRVLEAGITAQEALAKNGNQKLVLTELMLAL